MQSPVNVTRIVGFFSGPICGLSWLKSSCKPQIASICDGWVRFSPFSPSVEFFSSAPEIQRGKWNTLGRRYDLDFRRIQASLHNHTKRRGGEVAHNRRRLICLLPLAQFPRLRSAPLFRIRIAKSRRRHSSIITMR